MEFNYLAKRCRRRAWAQVPLGCSGVFTLTTVPLEPIHTRCFSTADAISSRRYLIRWRTRSTRLASQDSPVSLLIRAGISANARHAVEVKIGLLLGI